MKKVTVSEKNVAKVENKESSLMQNISIIKSSVKMISAAELVNLLIANFGTALLIVASFLIGMLWTEVRYLKKGTGLGYGGGDGNTVPTNSAINKRPAPEVQFLMMIEEIQ
jgi:hypothetical protein